ncbi:MAG: GGDEF domain-containing protein [Cyanobacteria bacterium P01_G01_bin.39]
MLNTSSVIDYLTICDLVITLTIFGLILSLLRRLKFPLQKKALDFLLLGMSIFAIAKLLAVIEMSIPSAVVDTCQAIAQTVLVLCISISLLLFKQSEKVEVARLRRYAFRDGLTGFYNHAFFSQFGRQKFLEAKRRELPLCAMMLDLDNFKAYNDRFGHEAGNGALRCFAQELKQISRGYDLVARYGGEEFVILVNSTIEDSFTHAQRICHRIAEQCVPKHHQELHQPLTVSIGLAPLTGAMNSLEELIKAADLELYRAKKTGKNRVYTID